MVRIIKVAATQFACSSDFDANVCEAVSLVREAASKGANIILLQELFRGIYFCQVDGTLQFIFRILHEQII